MGKLVVFLLGAVLLAATASKSDEPVTGKGIFGDYYLKVKTSSGYVQGYWGNSCRTGKQFAGFRGIPYAEAPVGELRFRDPVPKKSWGGVWDATYQRQSCIQGTVDGKVNTPPKDFSEDCLYLNVYTPNVNYLKFRLVPLKAVMVFIHPGAFTTGSSDETTFSPDFLIDQDVVLVTFNYRLGALGFLSLQNEEVPGNAGLKDQNLALKWVKENIKEFGGDPSRITIFGESAGAASVNYHLIAKPSAGLFANAIMQSGSSLSPWAYSTPDVAVQRGLSLAKKLDCKKTDLKDVLRCLQRMTATDIIKHQQQALTLHELLTYNVIAFQPTTEPTVPGAFLTKHPFDLMDSGNFSKVPSIVGLTMDEGLMIYPQLEEKDPHGLLLSLLGMDLSRFAPYYLHLRPFAKAAIMAHKRISSFYFQSKMVTKAMVRNFLELITDVMFTFPIQHTAGLLAESSVPVYNYLFTYEGQYNAGKAAVDILDFPGVSHGDELGYLFYIPPLHTKCGNVSADYPDEKTIDRITKMWANFAKTGNPTPEKDKALETTWSMFTRTNRSYLDIGEKLVPANSLKLANIVFWESLIRDLIRMVGLDGQNELVDDLESPK